MLILGYTEKTKVLKYLSGLRTSWHVFGRFCGRGRPVVRVDPAVEPIKYEVHKPDLPSAISIITVLHMVLAKKKHMQVVCIRKKATYDVILRIATSPNDMGGISSDPKIPSSQPACWSQLTCTPQFAIWHVWSGLVGITRRIPRMTRPAPIRVVRSPRPTDVSNLAFWLAGCSKSM